MIDVLLLLALPASGKSEVRRYLASLDARARLEDFGLGELQELDDYPYVHRMRRVDEALVKLGHESLFFASPDRSFRDARDWGTLVRLLDEDFGNLIRARTVASEDPGEWMLARFDRARQENGMQPLPLSSELRRAVAGAIGPECASLLEELNAGVRSTREGTTVILEMSRGGKEGAEMPLPAPFGYRYSLARLSPSVLERASILYIAVTPAESRKKNEARADPNDPGSILHHGVPEFVMRNDYGSDDFDWLVSQSPREGAARIETPDGRMFDLPAASFDNHSDRTSFLRNPPHMWAPAELDSLRGAMRAAFATLATSAEASSMRAPQSPR